MFEHKMYIPAVGGMIYYNQPMAEAYYAYKTYCNEIRDKDIPDTLQRKWWPARLGVTGARCLHVTFIENYIKEIYNMQFDVLISLVIIDELSYYEYQFMTMNADDFIKFMMIWQ